MSSLTHLVYIIR